MVPPLQKRGLIRRFGLMTIKHIAVHKLLEKIKVRLNININIK